MLIIAIWLFPDWGIDRYEANKISDLDRGLTPAFSRPLVANDRS
jgi:hypothetical protein